MLTRFDYYEALQRMKDGKRVYAIGFSQIMWMEDDIIYYQQGPMLSEKNQTEHYTIDEYAEFFSPPNAFEHNYVTFIDYDDFNNLTEEVDTY